MYKNIFIWDETYPNWQSFNPCFNGRCIRTMYLHNSDTKHKNVSILVLMEDV